MFAICEFDLTAGSCGRVFPFRTLSGRVITFRFIILRILIRIVVVRRRRLVVCGRRWVVLLRWLRWCLVWVLVRRRLFRLSCR